MLAIFPIFFFIFSIKNKFLILVLFSCQLLFSFSNVTFSTPHKTQYTFQKQKYFKVHIRRIPSHTVVNTNEKTQQPPRYLTPTPLVTNRRRFPNRRRTPKPNQNGFLTQSKVIGEVNSSIYWSR